MEQGTDRARVGSRIPTFPQATSRPANGVPVPKFGFTGRAASIPRPQPPTTQFSTALSFSFDPNETRLVKPTTLNTAAPSRQGHYSGSGSEDGSVTTPGEALTPLEEDHWKRSLGKRVSVGGVKTGTLLYFGKTHFANGYFCGVKLDEPEGRHDGSLDGVRYYNCPPKFGIFAPVSKVYVTESPVGLPPIRNSYSAGAMDSYTQFELGITKSRLPARKPIVGKNNQRGPRRDSDTLSSTFVAELTSPQDRKRSNKMRQSTSLNSTFVQPYNGVSNGSRDEFNHTFSNGDANLNRTTTVPFDATAVCSSLNNTYPVEEMGCTFNAGHDSVNSTPSPDAVKVIGAFDPKDELYDVPEDEMDESSLGLLSPSQMMDFSIGTDVGITIPKTHSCDDINDLPEEEVVENITVEYTDATVKSQITATRFPGDTPTAISKKSLQRLSSTPVGYEGPKARKVILGSPIASVDPEPSMSESMDDSVSLDPCDDHTFSITQDECSMIADQEITLVNLTFNRSGYDSILEDKEESIREKVREELMSSEKPEQLASVLKEGSIGEALLRTLKDVDLQKLGQSPGCSFNKERDAVLDNAARYEDSLYPKRMEIPAQTVGFCPMTKSVEWSTDVVDIFRKSRLVSSTGSIGNSEIGHDDNRVSIEKVMEVIQREGELYKNRPASTFTVGSADTGYQGDAEFDQHSEIGTTAGSPSEEAKFMSVCSQDSAILNTDNEADKLVKSGHMSDSDFFTDQERNSEMENDADMKRSASSSTDGAKLLTGITEDEDDTLLATASEVVLEPDSLEIQPVEEITQVENTVPMDEELSLDLKTDSLSKETKDRNNSMVIESRSCLNDTRVQSASAKSNLSVDSKKASETQEATRVRLQPKNPKKTIVVTKPAPVKVVGVSKIKALLEASSPTPEEIAARRAARTPKKSRWDSVTAKISDDKDKPKVKREIKSRVNTNLAGARQAAKRVDSGKENDNSEASGHLTPSSKSQTVTGATDSLLPRDPPSHCSSRDTDDVADCNLEPNSCASTSTSNKALSFATSETNSVFERPMSEIAVSEKSLASSHISHATNGPQFKSKIYRFQSVGQSQLGTQSKTSARGSNLENKKPTSSKFPSAGAANARLRSKDSINLSKPPQFPRALAKKETETTAAKPTQSSAAISRGASRLATSGAPSQSRLTNKPGVAAASKQMAPRDVNLTRNRSNVTAVSSIGTGSTSMRIRSAQVVAGKVEELSKEVQRLGALCEARTKELNMVKMQTKHTALGFDAFGVLVKYLVGELDAFSHPDLVADIQKTKEQLITLETVLKQYEEDVEQMKTSHSDKLNSLTQELKHSEEELLALNNKLNETDAIRTKEVRDTVEAYDIKAKEVQQIHLHSVENLKISHQREIEGLELQLKEKLEETIKQHEAEKDELKAQIEIQKKKYLSMEQTAKAFEDTLNKDTDAKIQWISAKNQELQQEVDSLKSVLDMKQQEIHALRAENMKMKKGLEELPLERHRVMKLQARNEELQALVRDKVKSEKKLSCEHRRLKEYLEQEEKYKQQLTMENEELHWKIKHSFDGSSFLNATVDGNVISLVATPELTERFKNLRAMSFNPLSPFRESHEHSNPMQTSIACLEDAKKTFRNNKPKPRRPSKSCSASPRKSPSRHHLASAFVASTPGAPSAHCFHKPLDLSKLEDRSELLDEALDISGTSSRSLESPQESLTELHFKACLHIDAMEEMAQMTNAGLDPGATRALLQSPDGMSSDSGGPGGCSSLASSSVAEDGMSASVSSVEPDDKDLLGLTPDTSFYGICSPRNEAGETMLGTDNSPFFPNGGDTGNSPEPVESVSITTTSTCTNSKTSNATSYEPCFCDDFDINSEPE